MADNAETATPVDVPPAAEDQAAESQPSEPAAAAPAPEVFDLLYSILQNVSLF